MKTRLLLTTLAIGASAMFALSACGDSVTAEDIPGLSEAGDRKSVV